MKNSILIGLSIAATASLSGCAATFEQAGQDFQREVGGGYPAIVKLYSLDGKLLQVWEGSKVLPTTDDDGDPSLTFIIDGRKVTISGTYSIEEKQ